jgi:hypothetical protein
VAGSRSSGHGASRRRVSPTGGAYEIAAERRSSGCGNRTTQQYPPERRRFRSLLGRRSPVRPNHIAGYGRNPRECLDVLPFNVAGSSGHGTNQFGHVEPFPLPVPRWLGRNREVRYRADRLRYRRFDGDGPIRVHSSLSDVAWTDLPNARIAAMRNTVDPTISSASSVIIVGT